MSRIRFRRDLHFWLNGREYFIKKRLPNCDFQVCNVLTEELSSFAEAALCHLYFGGNLEFEPPQDRNTTEKSKSYKSADFTQIDERLREEAKRRFRYVNYYFKQCLQTRTEQSLQPVIDTVTKEIDDSKPPSWITLYRWIKRYEESNHDIRSLVTNHIAKGNSQKRLPVEVHKIIDEVVQEVYLSLGKPNVAAAISEIIYRVTQENAFREKINLEQLPVPHPSTVYRIVQKLDLYEEAVARYGRRQADKEYKPSQHVNQHATRPLEIVELDHTKLPFFVVDAETRLPIGTPYLTSAVDNYGSFPIGYYLSFEPFSALSVMQCLWHAIRPKDYIAGKFPRVKNTWDAYGLMESIKVDNALEFHGKHLEDVALQLGFVIDFAPPKMPWYKARVERFFGAINNQLLSGQPGSFLKNLRNYHDEYDPYKSAVVSLDQLHEMIHIFLVDIACQSSHPKFGTPKSEVWRQSIIEFPPTLPSSEKDLRVLLGSITKRVISQHGIEFEGLYYRCPELAYLRSIYEERDKRRKTGTKEREKATIKFDPTDISSLYAFDPTKNEFIKFDAVDQEYTKGLSLWQHKVIVKLAREEAEKVDIIALSIAKKKIQGIVASEWKLSKGGKTRMAMARFLAIGRDGLDIENVEAFHAKQEFSAVMTNVDKPIDTKQVTSEVSGKLPDITGISNPINNFESLKNIVPEDLSDISDDFESVEEISTEVETVLEEKEQKTKISSSRRSKSSLKSKECQEVQPELLGYQEPWKPDTSGWSTSYGIPEKGN